MTCCDSGGGVWSGEWAPSASFGLIGGGEISAVGGGFGDGATAAWDGGQRGFGAKFITTIPIWASVSRLLSPTVGVGIVGKLGWRRW